METILLRRKEGEGDIVIFDDFFAGELTGSFYVIEQFGKIFLLTAIVDHFKFPSKNGENSLMILRFLQGHSPQIAKKVQFYEDDTIDI